MRKVIKLLCLLLLVAALSLPMLVSAASGEAQVLQGGTTVVATCDTLQQALDLAKDQQDLSVKLLKDVTTTATLSGTVYLDLAGFDLEGLKVEGTLYGMDSATDNFRGEGAGSLKTASGAPAVHTKTTAAQVGAVKRYLAVNAKGSYSFHRFYIGITSMALSPETGGMGYRATFAGDAQVKASLDIENAFGVVVGLESLPATLENANYRGGHMAEFMEGVAFSRVLTIANVLSEEAINNDARGQMDVYGSAYIRLKDGTTIFSSQVSRDMRQMMEAVDANWSAYTAEEQTRVNTLLKTYEKEVSNWNVKNIHHFDQEVWQPWTGTWVNGGHYYLTGDVVLTKMITIPRGESLTICLNGHDIDSSIGRMFQIKGNFAICDHQNADGTFDGDVTTHHIGKTFAPVFYVFEHAVFDLCGGNLRQGEGTIFGRAGVGMVGNGNEENAYATMNFYAGTISGGHVRSDWDVETGNYAGLRSGYGANLDLVSYSILNMYGGKITGGIIEAGMVDENTPIPKENGDGGNLGMASSKSILNMYGGEISGGTVYTGSATYGGMGGNIYCLGTMNLYGGIIKDGTTYGGRGGNIYSAGKLNIGSVTITGGTATVYVEDGENVPETGLGGGIYSKSNVTSISGSPNITGNTDSDLYLSHTAVMDGVAVEKDARIGVMADINGLISSDPATADCFFANAEGYKAVAVGDSVSLVRQQVDAEAVTATEDTFRVGYAMVDITPREEGLILSSYGNPNGRKSSGVNYHPYVTCIAVTDREDNTFLMITMDLQNGREDMVNNVAPRISQVTGVPADNIYFSGTHTHNVPTPYTGSKGNTRYRDLVWDSLVQSAVEALADRAPATMQMGNFDTQGMNYSRHYYYYNAAGEKVYFGDQFGSAPKNGEKVYRVREGDETMHMLEFWRDGADPVLIVNWRAHPHRSGGKTAYTVDADVIGATREYIHKNTDYLFAYFQGAAGNMNTTSRISGQTYKSGKITEYGNELGRQILEGRSCLQPAETGLIQTKKVIYAAKVNHTEDHLYDQAIALQNIYKNEPDRMDTMEKQLAVAAEYGFSSYFHASRMLEKYKLGETKDLNLNIFSIGNSVAFFTAPAELWDSFSEEMETLSPFAETWCVGYCNGTVAYIPYQVDYSSYEYHYCLFEQDYTILTMQEIYLTGLREQFENAQ